MRNPHRTRLIAALAAGALVVLAASAGTASASASPPAPRTSSVAGIPLPKVAIVFSQLNPDGNGVHLRIGDPLGLASRPLTNPVAGTYVNHAAKSPDGRSVLFEYETPDGHLHGAGRHRQAGRHQDRRLGMPRHAGL